MLFYLNIIFIVTIILIPLCHGIEPISTSVSVISGIAISIGFAAFEFTKCKRQECCTNSWINLNYSGLENSLQNVLHGQPLVEKIVLRSIKSHVQKKNPKKALVMTFQGSTGIGKNYAASMIAKNLYVEGMASKYVHLYICGLHFPHEDKIAEYRDQLQKEIEEFTKLCGQSLFIFDEVDKMPKGVLDVLKPYMDYYEDIGGVDYRRNIFIFLSNAGGNEIVKVSFDFWLNDKDRSDIRLKDIEPLINKGVFNEKGGLQHSNLVRNNLIDIYVPFFPLEKKHIKLCIRDELHSRKVFISDEDIDSIADQLEYYPPDFHVYSVSGCKIVSQKLDLHLDD